MKHVVRSTVCRKGGARLGPGQTPKPGDALPGESGNVRAASYANLKLV